MRKMYVQSNFMNHLCTEDIMITVNSLCMQHAKSAQSFVATCFANIISTVAMVSRNLFVNEKALMMEEKTRSHAINHQSKTNNYILRSWKYEIATYVVSSCLYLHLLFFVAHIWVENWMYVFYRLTISSHN